MQVRLKEYGSELIEVADNGSGVSPENYAALTQKYHTSKISNFQDVAGVTTFGFRGEALSSVCVVSNLSVTTRTAEQTVGVRLLYDHEGAITGAAASRHAAAHPLSAVPHCVGPQLDQRG